MKSADIIDLASQRTLRAVAKNTPRSVELIYNLSSLVELIKTLKAGWGIDLNVFKDTTFAHVLNTGLEDLWPGDVELFYPELFACRLSGVSNLFIDTSYMAEHKRCETQRRCNPYPERIPYFDYDFFRGLQGSFPCDVVIPCELEDVDNTDWVLDSPPQGREH